MKHPTMQDLSAAEWRLVRIMSENQFGWISNLRVKDGYPLMDGDVKVIRIARLGSDSPSLQTGSGDFQLKRAITDLFGELKCIGTGVVQRLEFRHGLPVQLEIAVAADRIVVSEESVVYSRDPK